MGPFLAPFWHHFSKFFRHRFSDRFFYCFFAIFGPKMVPKLRLAHGHLSTIFELLSEGWMHSGRSVAPFWHLFAPFGSLLAPFGSLLAPFGSHFCSLWLTFCSFWLTFTPFSHFGRLLASFLVPFRYFQRKSNEKSCFSMFFSEFPTFYAPASAKHLQTNRRNPSFAQRQIFAYIYLSRPGADNCRRQLRSALGLLGAREAC